jgi:hypothetical protein
MKSVSDTQPSAMESMALYYFLFFECVIRYRPTMARLKKRFFQVIKNTTPQLYA